MNLSAPSERVVAAALRRIGIDPEPPSVDALMRLHRAWVERVPYESVWIHMAARWDIDPGASLERVAYQSRGGYCYQMNGALSLILSSLGYRVTRHVGGVHGPEGPDFEALTNHLVLVVRDLPTADNPEGRWYVDAGLGDGLHQPLPLQPGTYQQGPLTVHLDRSADGIGDWHFTHDPTGSFAGMSFRTAPVEMDVFGPRHEHLSTSPESSFASVVTAQLRFADGTDILRGCVLTRRRGHDSTAIMLETREDWFAALADVFTIRPAAHPPAQLGLWDRVLASHQRWLESREQKPAFTSSLEISSGEAVPVLDHRRTLAPCDPFDIPSTSHWTGAATIVPAWWTKTCIVTRLRTSPRPMPSSLAG